MKKDMHNLIEFIEDSRPSEEERALLSKSISKIKSGSKSGFTSHRELKKELGLQIMFSVEYENQAAKFLKKLS